MTVLKIACLGMAGMMTGLLMKEMKSPFAVPVSLITCVLIAFFTLHRLEIVVDIRQSMEQMTSLKTAWFQILMKIAGIAYLTDISASLCKDAGYQAIAGQIELFGKLSVLAVSSPVILALMETVSSAWS